MIYVVTGSYEELSSKAVTVIAAQIIVKPNTVLGLAAGSSPVGAYRQLVKYSQSGFVDFSKVTTVNLDEYVGLEGTNNQNYRYFMKDNLFDHINIDKANTHVPNGCAADLREEGVRYDAMIASIGGIDLQLLGIGVDGPIDPQVPASILQLHPDVTV